MKPELIISHSDLVYHDVEAIVNSANELLIPGGGVDGAIHRVADRELIEAKKALGGCPTGEARHTYSYGLKAKYIIHTVAPRYNHPLFKYNKDKEELLALCYSNSLELATKLKVSSVAFPALGTGVYGWNHELSAHIAINTMLNWLKLSENNLSVQLILPKGEICSYYKSVYNSIITRL